MRDLFRLCAERLVDICRTLFAIDPPRVADRDNDGIFVCFDKFAQMIARTPAAADLSESDAVIGRSLSGLARWRNASGSHRSSADRRHMLLFSARTIYT